MKEKTNFKKGIEHLGAQAMWVLNWVVTAVGRVDRVISARA